MPTCPSCPKREPWARSQGRTEPLGTFMPDSMGTVVGRMGIVAENPMNERDVWWASKIQGCTCRPDITPHPATTAEFPQWDVKHDDWCALVDRGSQILVMNRALRRKLRSQEN